jgi:hypothetical protein
MADLEQARKLWWAVPAGAVLVLMLLAMLLGGEKEVKPGSSYDAGNQGFRAAYLLLEELGYPVTRARLLDGGTVRWALFPLPSPKEAPALDAWVREGGVLVLADPKGDFSGDLGIHIETRKSGAEADEEPATGPDVRLLAGGPDRVTWPGQAGRVWAEAGGEPFVTVYPRGRGEVWLLNRPDFVTNRQLRRADNAVLLCRLAEAGLRERPGEIAFDEYFHGMRDRPGIAELLLRPPALWVSLQALLLLAVVLWHYGPRFGGVRPPPPRTRRSAQEFLDAVAALLARKKDYADAYRTARDELRGDLERELGLPHGTPADRLAAEAARRRGVASDALLRLLTASGPAAGAGPGAFVRSLQELETCRDTFLPRRRPG